MIYPRSVHGERIVLYLNCEWSNAKAEAECVSEKRRYIPKQYFEAARKTPEKRRASRLFSEWRRDELNLAQCRKFINKTKEILRENT